MRMLEVFFLPLGRLNRVQFLLWSLALSVILAIVMSILLYSSVYDMVVQAKQQKTLSAWDYIRIFSFPAAIFLILGIWAPAAMMAKRFRDMNFPAFMAVGTVFLVHFIDLFVLSRFLEGGAFGRTVVGSAFDIMVILVLLLMPPHEGDDDGTPDLHAELAQNRQARRAKAQEFLQNNGYYDAYAEGNTASSAASPMPARASFGKKPRGAF